MPTTHIDHYIAKVYILAMNNCDSDSGGTAVFTGMTIRGAFRFFTSSSRLGCKGHYVTFLFGCCIEKALSVWQDTCGHQTMFPYIERSERHPIDVGLEYEGG